MYRYVQVYDVDDGALSVLHLVYNELRALAAHDEEKGMRTDRRPVTSCERFKKKDLLIKS